uniref:LOW QUALITY PROTEIN: LOB domain-containing protein 19 n=2 Tax=Cicer arietinum TaxID=3827 RepID=A0A1S2XPU6_CICAR|nr:LOW QUALITY PROTEIN: LOB domain-containing protein 19 [Cicer arietinum]
MEFECGRSGGPCGACKFLRRKCVKDSCIFAPYFESSVEGTAHFAAIHKVFGASNASKLLMQIPLHKRLDAVLSLCYEALARVTDPVYGCVAHIFALQQQVVKLQAELAHAQARLSILKRISIDPQFQHPQSSSLSPNQHSSLLDHRHHHVSSNNEINDYMSMHFDNHHPTPFDITNLLNPSSSYSYHQQLHDQEVLAQLF